MEDLVVLAFVLTGGGFILRVVWNTFVEKLIEDGIYDDGIDHEDGTGSIW